MANEIALKRTDRLPPQASTEPEWARTERFIAEWQSRVRTKAVGSRPSGGLTAAIRKIVDPVGGVELDLPPRAYHREIRFDDWGEFDS